MHKTLESFQRTNNSTTICTIVINIIFRVQRKSSLGSVKYLRKLLFSNFQMDVYNGYQGTSNIWKMSEVKFEKIDFHYIFTTNTLILYLKQLKFL